VNSDVTQHVVPVGYIIAAFVAALAAALGAAWGGFSWLLARIDDRFKANLRGEVFETTVRKIVTDAQAGWLDIHNRQYEESRRSIADVRSRIEEVTADMKKRDEERAGSVKRLHERVDKVWERFNDRGSRETE
jgi:hypothetical protein